MYKYRKIKPWNPMKSPFLDGWTPAVNSPTHPNTSKPNWPFLETQPPLLQRTCRAACLPEPGDSDGCSMGWFPRVISWSLSSIFLGHFPVTWPNFAAWNGKNPEINRECVFVIFSEPWNVDKWSWNHVGQPFAEVTYTSPQSDTMRFYGNVHQCVENLFDFQGYICRMFQWIDCKCVTQSMNVHTN